MKVLKNIGKFLLIALAVIIILIFLIAIYNQMALKLEKKKIVPNGQLVDMGKYKIHVYAEGEKSDKPTLVFMAGSATVAPVYDFKPLYSLLSDEYRIAVVEKAGYGYSDIYDVKRDVATMVNEVRTALSVAEGESKYVLLPHSMSGLEAIYWAQEYPDEVAAIVGLDMATPESYDTFDINKVNQTIVLGGALVKIGIHRIPGVYPLNNTQLNDDEMRQHKLLMYKNAVNSNYIREGKEVCNNAQIVKENGNISCPVLMFASNGKEIGEFWLPSQKKFAEETSANIEFLDCGHYIHYYESEQISKSIKQFLQLLA